MRGRVISHLRKRPPLPLKENDPCRRAHGRRADEEIEGKIILKMIVEPAQRALHPEVRIGGDEFFGRIGRSSVQEIGDRLTGRVAMFQRGMDSARRQRRHHAGGVSHEQRAGPCQGAHQSPTWYEAGADMDRRRVANIEERCDLLEEGAHCGLRFAGGAAQSPCQSDLDDADACNDPADIARRQTAIDETMQPVRAIDRQALIFVLDAEDEFAVLPKPQAPGDLR